MDAVRIVDRTGGLPAPLTPPEWYVLARTSGSTAAAAVSAWVADWYSPAVMRWDWIDGAEIVFRIESGPSLYRARPDGREWVIEWLPAKPQH